MLEDVSQDAIEKAGLVLVVDDDRSTRFYHQAILSSVYEVSTAGSGDEALEIFNGLNPDLIVLDVEMPGLNGYETCRRIRQTSSIPIIFVTAHTSLEAQLEAFEAGANDIVSKPISKEVFLHKIALAIKNRKDYQRISQEKDSLQSLAMNFLSSVGETGVLLNFLRGSISSRSYEELAEKLVEAARSLDMECYGAIRATQGLYGFRTHGEPSGLEQEVLSKLASMGRVFQFKKQLVVNYDHVSVVVKNLPLASDAKTGAIRDNLCVLAEASEALCENVGMRQESMARAESMQVALVGAVTAVEALQQEHRLMLGDTRILLQELVDGIEKAFSWLGTTTDQEQAISSMMHQSVQQILDLLMTRGQFEGQFNAVLNALRGSNSTSEIELF